MLSLDIFYITSIFSGNIQEHRLYNVSVFCRITIRESRGKLGTPLLWWDKSRNKIGD